MNWGVALALIPLLGLVALASYVDRVYQEIGKFLSREFQDNIDCFEQKVEPKPAREPRPSFALHGSAQAVDHGHHRLACGLRGLR
jgi:putative hemolysin